MSTVNNFKQYNQLIVQYPYFKTILEDVFGTNPRYALHEIWHTPDSTVFYFNQSCHCNFTNENINILKKYKVYMQVVGSSYNYLFSIDIKHKE